jgi:FecR protein
MDMPDARMRGLMLATLLVALSPLPVRAQTQPVGVVTTLTGQATLARTALPEPLILKFKDDVFERDRISTAEKSIVRVLLGGKAIITVRELSVVTIIEEPGRATVDLTSGKIGVSVAKQRMRPGESLEIRTPNAVAAVRGTVITVETAMVAGTQVTDYDVQSGTLDLLAPRPEILAPGRGITVSGLTAGVPRAARPDAFTAGFERESGTGAGSTGAATEGPIANGMRQASALALAISPPPPPQLAGPILGGSTGTIQLPPINGITRIPDAEIRGGDTGGAGAGGAGAGGGTKANVLVNGGFETGVLTPWTLNGAGGIVTSLGSITAPEGQNMALLHTATGALSVSGNPGLFPSPPTNTAGVVDVTEGSRLSQGFSVAGGSLYTIKVNYNFITNEFPTQSVDDPFRSYVISPSGTMTQLAFESRLTSAFQTSSEVSTTLGFTASSSHGLTGFKQVTTQWVPETSGTATLSFDVFDRGDTIFDSAALVDATSVAQDPPLYFLRRGDSLVRNGSDPLLRLSNATQTFDSLMVVCCDGRATLAGPLLHATDSNLTVPWSLLAVMQGGVLTTSSTDPLARLDGGVYTFGGGGVPMFDLYGTGAAVDPETGLTLGTHRPLQHGGSLLEASNATISATQVVRVDNALLEASAPLLSLKNGSQLTTTNDAVQLSYQAKVTSLGSVMKLDRSALTVARGAALNLAGGSVLRVTGDLFSLTNGSSLSLLSGPLVSLSGGSFLNVAGALIGFGGTGGNLVSVANGLCPCTSIGGIPVSLTGGAVASNVSINGAVKNGGLGSLNLTPNAAVIRVDGAGTKVTINGM